MRKVIIIGATSGIGKGIAKGIAKVLADNNYKVGITGRLAVSRFFQIYTKE
jgi:short-subunit dehydrogenase